MGSSIEGLVLCNMLVSKFMGNAFIFPLFQLYGQSVFSESSEITFVQFFV